MSLSNAWPPSRPYVLSLDNPNPPPSFPSNIGSLEGLTFLTTAKGSKTARSHYFGGIPYAHQPTRWKIATPLDSNHTYGSAAAPQVVIGEVGLCPQPGDFGSAPGPEQVELWDENCLQLNIFVPVEDPKRGVTKPNSGWPVMVFLHGGYLSFGSPNGSDYMGLLETEGRCVLVLVGYRVNLFGFLAGDELAQEDRDSGGSGLAGNYGFWDQRCALEWVRDRIGYFGGDKGQVTLCGYSAGALSAFHQLTHEFSIPYNQRVIRRVMMLANGPGMQPRSVGESQLQFDELLTAMNIPAKLSYAAKLARLRKATSLDLVSASLAIKRHEFRHVTDEHFIKSDLFSEIDNGEWVRKFKDQNVELLLCECETEHFAFATWHEPGEDTLQAVRDRLSVDYPREVIDALVDNIYMRNKSKSRIQTKPKLPPEPINGHICKSWKEFNGIVYAELQVHAIQRAFAEILHRHGAGSLVRRCRVGWRAKRADINFPKDMGATHGTDTALWFFGDGVGLELLKKEEKIAREWCEGWWKWVKGEGWGDGWEVQDKAIIMKYIDLKGFIGECEDEKEDWNRGLEIWKAIRRVQQGDD